MDEGVVNAWQHNTVVDNTTRPIITIGTTCTIRSTTKLTVDELDEDLLDLVTSIALLLNCSYTLFGCKRAR
jgi:hypothetical protein